MMGLMCFDKVASLIAYNLPNRGNKWWSKATRPKTTAKANCQWWFMVGGFEQLTEEMWAGRNVQDRLDSQLSLAEWKVVWEWKKDLVKYFLMREHITNCNTKREDGKPQKNRLRFAIISDCWPSQTAIPLGALSVSKQRRCSITIPSGEAQPGSFYNNGIDWPRFVGAVQGHSIPSIDEGRMYPCLTLEDLADTPNHDTRDSPQAHR